MSDEGDYLSENFLAGVGAQPPSGSKAYAQRRREAQRRSEFQNLQGKSGPLTTCLRSLGYDVRSHVTTSN